MIERCTASRQPAKDRPRTIAARLLLCMPALLLSVSASADPPSWAPAHGWRKKQPEYHVGESGHRWPRDYGVLRGTCDYQTVGAVLGGAVGGAVGASVGRGDTRAVAIVVGAVLGAVVGARIGREIEEADRGCIGQALELAESGRGVSWDNASTGVRYLLIPKNEYRRQGALCRDYELSRRLGDRTESGSATACLDETGRWVVAR